MCERCRNNCRDELCNICQSSIKLKPNSYNEKWKDIRYLVEQAASFNDSPDFLDFPPQPQYETYSCELSGNDAHFGYDCPTQVPFISNPDPCYNQKFDNNFPQTSPSLLQNLCCIRCGGPHETFQSDQLIFDEPYCENCEGPHMSFQCQPMNQNFYNSNSSGFDQFPQYPVSSQPPEESVKEFCKARSRNDNYGAIRYQNIIKSSVEDLVPIPSESEGIFDNMCDVPFCDKNHFDVESDLMESFLNRDTSIIYSPQIDSLLEDFAGELAPINPIPLRIHETDSDPEEDIHLIEQLLYDDTSCDDAPFEDIDYVEASPPDFELVSLEEVEDDILRDKLLNIHILISKIESLNDNPTPDCVLKSPFSSPIPVEDSDSFLEETDTSLSYMDNSLLEFKTFSDHTEETRSGSTTSHADDSLPQYDSFHFEIEPDSGELISAVMDDIFEGNEDKCFDPGGGGIDASPNDCPDFEDSRACSFVHRSLDLQSFAWLYMGIRYPRSYSFVEIPSGEIKVRLNGAARRSCVGDLKTIEKDGCGNVGDGHRGIYRDTHWISDELAWCC
ncbi:hypothetical protein Tco_0504961 [Tanacetum coccineum]